MLGLETPARMKLDDCGKITVISVQNALSKILGRLWFSVLVKGLLSRPINAMHLFRFQIIPLTTLNNTIVRVLVNHRRCLLSVMLNEFFVFRTCAPCDEFTIGACA
jgi:hypothetical protein